MESILFYTPFRKGKERRKTRFENSRTEGTEGYGFHPISLHPLETCSRFPKEKGFFVFSFLLSSMEKGRPLLILFSDSILLYVGSSQPIDVSEGQSEGTRPRPRGREGIDRSHTQKKKGPTGSVPYGTLLPSSRRRDPPTDRRMDKRGTQTVSLSLSLSLSFVRESGWLIEVDPLFCSYPFV